MGVQDQRGDDIDGHLPLKPQWFHMLLALSGATQHGSGIVRTVLEQTDGKLRLWPVTLYSSLDELVEHGWIRELTEPGERPSGESGKKRFYRITGDGATILAAEANRLRSLAMAALERVSSETGTT